MSISKKLRFEVFKRDKFTCQYCGKSAPDVVLHVDHIEPKSKGGEDDLLNLATACVACNLGKSDRRLSDDSIVVKQRDQLAELQERQEQISMLMEWKRGIVDLDNEAVEQAATFWEELVGWGVSDEGKRQLKRHIGKFGLSEVLDAMRVAVEVYVKFDAEGEALEESGEVAFKKIPSICATKRAEKEKPYLKDLYYIRGIARNRCGYFKDWEAKELLDTAYSWGAATDELKHIACTTSSWSRWSTVMNEYIKILREQDANG